MGALHEIHMRNVIGSRGDVDWEVVHSVNQKYTGSPVSCPHLYCSRKTFCLKFVNLNSVSMSGYSPGPSGIRGPLRAIQDPPPHEDRPNVEKKKVMPRFL